MRLLAAQSLSCARLVMQSKDRPVPHLQKQPRSMPGWIDLEH